jgi:hypothetical protein
MTMRGRRERGRKKDKTKMAVITVFGQPYIT